MQSCAAKWHLQMHDFSTSQPLCTLRLDMAALKIIIGALESFVTAARDSGGGQDLETMGWSDDPKVQMLSSTHTSCTTHLL